MDVVSFFLGIVVDLAVDWTEIITKTYLWVYPRSVFRTVLFVLCFVVCFSRQGFSAQF